LFFFKLYMYLIMVKLSLCCFLTEYHTMKVY
jgi:hypothetical protein